MSGGWHTVLNPAAPMCLCSGLHRAMAQQQHRTPWLGATPGCGCMWLLVSALLGLWLQGQLRFTSYPNPFIKLVKLPSNQMSFLLSITLVGNLCLHTESYFLPCLFSFFFRWPLSFRRIEAVFLVAWCQLSLCQVWLEGAWKIPLWSGKFQAA